MVSLSKPEITETVRAVEVKHLMTEEQAIAANTPIIEVRKTTQPLAVASNSNEEDLKKRLEAAEKEAEQNWRCFEWALFAIFALLFVAITVIGHILPHEPDEITWVVWVQILFGSMMLGSLMTNTMHSLHIHLFD